MSNFSFKDTQEEKVKTGTKISTGIHEVKVKEVKVVDVPAKGDNPSWKKGQVVFEATKTIEGKDSVGKTIEYDILYPRDQEGAEKLGKRIMHIFSKVSTKDKIETVKGAIQKLDLSSIDTLMAGIKKIADGRSLRLKVVANQEGKYPMIPLYYAGYAETIDTTPSELRYDEAKEGTKYQPTNTEATSDAAVADSDLDTLPF